MKKNISSPARKGIAAEQFLRALNKPGITDLMLSAYDVFQAPILLCDLNFRIVFQHPKKPIGDWNYDTYLEKKELPLDALSEWLKNKGDNQYDWPTTPEYRKVKLPNEHFCITGVVSNNRTRILILGIYIEPYQIQPDDLEITELLISALTFKYQNNFSGTQEWSPLPVSCLREILKNHNSMNLCEINAKVLSQTICGGYCLGVGKAQPKMDWAGIASKQSEKFNMNQIILTEWDDSFVVLSGNSFSDEPNTVMLQLQKDIQQELLPNHFYFAYSAVFTDLKELFGHYIQAKSTAQLAEMRMDTKPLYFEQEIPYQMFIELSKQPNSRFYVNSALSKIRQSDLENGTDYYRSLRIWCLTLFNKGRAANAIIMHRNTLCYHLNIITERFNLNLNDENIRLNLLCSFLLQDAISKTDA